MERQLGRLWTQTPAMHAVFDTIIEVARASAPVLIQGETGTGKELIAEAIHEHSPRSDGPYIVIDCTSLPAELIETELFGHEKGAFTGATSERTGAFFAANGGSVFIDEIGELPLELQPRLLRVLEKQEVKKVGGNRTQTLDARVIAATNRDLALEVAAGRFRQDLYFRLNVLKISVPPLRQRSDDILFLARKFLADFGLELTPAVEAQLSTYPWPGNVRELRNVIDRGAALSDDTFRLPEDFGQTLDLSGPWNTDNSTEPANISKNLTPVGDITRPLWEGLPYKEARDAVMADFEKGWLDALLKTHGGNISAAARASGLHRNLIHRMIARYGK